jgi:hypothetical protein
MKKLNHIFYFVLIGLFVVFRMGRAAQATSLPTDSSCHAVYYTTTQLLYLPCVDVVNPPNTTTTWQVMLQQIGSQFVLSSAAPRNPVVNEPAAAVACHAFYYPATGIADLPCILVRDQTGSAWSQSYQGQLQQLFTPGLSLINFAVAALEEKAVPVNPTPTPVRNTPSLLTPANGTQQQALPFSFSWALNNDANTLTDVQFSVVETTGLNGAPGNTLCAIHGAGSFTRYTSAECGNFKAGQWYLWTIRLSFTDQSTKVAQAYFSTVAPPVTPVPVESSVVIGFSGNGTGLVTISPLNKSCNYNGTNTNGCQAIMFNGGITLTAEAGDGTVFTGWSGACTGNRPTCSLAEENSARAFTVSAQFKKEARVVLMLHGMNSDETTWNDYVYQEPKFAAECPAIVAGVVSGGVQLPATPPTLGCYRVRFGSYDATSGRKNLENITASGPKSGDFSTFDQLGLEVKAAVSAISNAYNRKYGADYPVKIVLLGHSRGGLAARAFLQSSATEKQAVAALLTTGTPHKGSPLGRVYQYLKNNCLYADGRRKGSYFFGMAMDACADDWQVVDNLKAGACNYLPLSEERLDVRLPTVDDLSDISNAISSLNAGTGALPSSVRLGALNYTGVELGRLARLYRIFDLAGTDVCDQVSRSAQSAILGNRQPTDPEFIGDGVVPSVSQNFPISVSVTRLRDNPRNTASSPILHTKEPREHLHLSQALDDLMPEWGLTLPRWVLQ